MSIEGRPIEAFVIGRRITPTILVFGGFHGDEPKSVSIAERLLALLETDASARGQVRWAIIPLVNPDGYDRRQRRNASRVDINRNFPTENWESTAPRSRMFGGFAAASEPETQAVIHSVAHFNPDRIVTIHSISDGRECNNYDGPGRSVATGMGRRNGYPVKASIGYATPGSFGTWAGRERGIATITLELPTRHSLKRCWEDSGDALLYCGRSLAIR